MTFGSLTVLGGLSLWLMEEAYLLAPSVFPKHVPLIGGEGGHQAFFSTIAISGFPIGGLAIRPTDKPAVHALLRTWVGLCIMLGTVFSATSVIIFACDDKTWHEPEAEPLRYRILIHVTNAVLAFFFAHRFSRGQQLPHAEALQRAWAAGHNAGALIAVAWPLACWESLPLVPSEAPVSLDLFLFVLPSAALLCYVALTSSPLRARLLRWMWLFDELTAELHELKLELGETSALLIDERRRSAELEEARRWALVSSALARRVCEAGPLGADDLTPTSRPMDVWAKRGAGNMAPEDAASDGMEVDLQSSLAGVPPSLPPGPPSISASQWDEPEGPPPDLTRLHSLPDDAGKPNIPLPSATAAAGTARDGACCARGMCARGLQVLCEASEGLREQQAIGGALFDSLPPHQQDRLLMPPPPPRAAKANPSTAQAEPETSPSKRPRPIEVPRRIEMPGPDPASASAAASTEQITSSMQTCFIDSLGLDLVTVAPAAVCGGDGGSTEDDEGTATEGLGAAPTAGQDAAMEGLGAMVLHVASPRPASTGSTPILPLDVLVGLGGLPVATAASVHAITTGWPQGQELCASVVREGRLITPIWLMPQGGGSPCYGSSRAAMGYAAGREPSEDELEAATVHMVAQQRLMRAREAHLEEARGL